MSYYVGYVFDIGRLVLFFGQSSFVHPLYTTVKKITQSINSVIVLYTNLFNRSTKNSLSVKHFSIEVVLLIMPAKHDIKVDFLNLTEIFVLNNISSYTNPMNKRNKPALKNLPSPTAKGPTITTNLIICLLFVY